MATRVTDDRCYSEKLNGNAATQTADVSSTSSFASETGSGFGVPSISPTDHNEGKRTSEKQSNSELSQKLLKSVLEKWDSAFPPTPKETIESILGEDGRDSSTNENEKKDLSYNSSSHVQNVAAQKHIMGNTAATDSKKKATDSEKKKPKKLAKRDPFYNWAMPDTRVLSIGFAALSEAPMASEYDELWKETRELIQSECTRLRL